MGYTAGQCTAFVASLFPWAANTQWGDAYQWLAKARADGHLVSSVPVPGSIAVWGQNVGGAQSDGHVAAVVGVTPSGAPVVQEMNWTNGPFGIDTRVVGASSQAGIIGYILPQTNVAGTTIPGMQSATLASFPVPNPLDAITAPVGWATSLGTLLGNLTKPEFWWRVGFVAVGAAIIVAGFLIVSGHDLPDKLPSLPIPAE